MSFKSRSKFKGLAGCHPTGSLTPQIPGSLWIPTDGSRGRGRPWQPDGLWLALLALFVGWFETVLMGTKYHFRWKEIYIYVYIFGGVNAYAFQISVRLQESATTFGKMNQSAKSRCHSKVTNCQMKRYESGKAEVRMAKHLLAGLGIPCYHQMSSSEARLAR